MIRDEIDFVDTSFFSKGICDYLNQEPFLNDFYENFSSLEGVENQIQKKEKSNSNINREVLSDVISRQYNRISASRLTTLNINALRNKNTFTITTGHQLNLFGGHLYFLYKIITTINVARKLNQRFGQYKFIPVYWMATEDHDFEEINHFFFRGKKIVWDTHQKGAVGEFDTCGLDEVFRIFSQEIGKSSNAEFLKQLFSDCYLGGKSLADATRKFVNKLFGEYGLVIIDANDFKLKKAFVSQLKNEITHEISYKKVVETNEALSKLDYKIQVTPREINLFYKDSGLRERILKENELFKVNNHLHKKWTLVELLSEIDQHPERFSPNVILRPLYQEVILPNLCYIGGGGELMYWLQLKSTFESHHIPFPVLMLRHSALILNEKQEKKRKNLDISVKDLFLPKIDFINKKVREISKIDINLDKQKRTLGEQFQELYKIAEMTDKSFLGAVKAQEKKQLRGLENLEKRLLDAQKRKLSDHISRCINLKNELFPNESLQERSCNFSEFYLEYGNELIPKLIDSMKPFHYKFLIL